MWGETAEEIASSYERRLVDLRNTKKAVARPKVYFEEWDSPMITGIKLVSELIEIAGGVDVFSELSSMKVLLIGSCPLGKS